MSRRKSTRAQEYKMIGTLMACAFMSCVLFCRVSANPVRSKATDVCPDSNDTSKRAKTDANDLQIESVLKLYLPREVAIKDDTIRLGEISIIGNNQAKGGLADKAVKIPLGRITMPGQEIVIERSMILSRLACSGIPASKVKLTGAEKITVRKQQKIIKGSEFVELACAFLKKNPPPGSACQWNAIRIPKDLALPDTSKDIKLSSRLVGSTVKNQARVRVTVVQNGKQIDECEVIFRLKYNCRKAVTLIDIPAGEVISSKNVKIENVISNYPEVVNWKPPYGLIAKRPLPANAAIRPHMVGPLKPAVIVGRNQNVVIRIERPLLLVTAIGKTLQEGRVGEHIKVRNLNSQRIILAKVKEDGTVEPVF
ncbi:MAG: flagellar basal body P-ring formation protein FlgA [Phycisphaerae bacterium]|nr:flagellar basal body P-ring formation protein FlgA [Phycisphaerae bacterium]NIP52890.1 flagellar basal body P-ring formation protein FlgA [Phycisphaerae bacterium]NIS51941.1 flagellar basal body P-ring formation protein FlgA [Phycisphaerae bacterium]NIU09455.1 flagellar basal body P-ring formation protein FlgA [Phycisphaerae bacterium]NIU57188.1 flagellar basal body P-ring formation protein FlgA [Phycisphaerae bacterium]